MNPGPDAAGFGVYIHWPYCARICPYCDFNVHLDRRPGEAAELARAIVEDLSRRAASTGPRRLTSLFFGGGTPSLMAPANFIYFLHPKIDHYIGAYFRADEKQRSCETSS